MVQETNLSVAQQQDVRDRVREGYGEIARSQGKSCCGPGAYGGDADSAQQLAEAIGYGTDDLSALPEGANMGLSCGNPVALATLKLGERVVDLGSGGGFDVFIAGRRVGPTGRAIGVDMTPDMLSKARRNVQAYREQTGMDNVEFRLGEIEHLPLPDRSVDVVISNCVINLSPDKPQVWREIARVLKPGGRVAVSDLALLKPLSPEIRESVEALVGCVSGASLVDDIRRMIEEAGLVDIQLESRPGYVEAMTDINDTLYQTIAQQIPAGEKMSDYITSLSISARKAEREVCCGQ